jgi:putative copper export protein
MSVAALVVRWLSLASLAALIGAAALDVLVLPAGADTGETRRRLREWMALCAAVLIVGSAGELVLRASTMAGGDIGRAIGALPAVLGRTHFGTIWIVRFATLGLLIVINLVAAGGFRIALLFLAVGVGATQSLTAHAADAGPVSIDVFVDWAHVLASGMWMGGLVGLPLIVLRAMRTWPGRTPGVVATRFSRLAGLCLSVVVVSGAYNSWVEIPSIRTLITTTYGRSLAAKLLIVLGIVVIGGINRYRIVPGLKSEESAARRTFLDRFRVWVSVEVVLGLGVFVCTAVLTDSTPARHARHLAHAGAATPEPSAPFHVTMEQLHESGGVPKGWIFRPADGDADRGRQVFARLGCFACHAVQGESFPAPSGPGPDLTGMGAHHPAGYLAESVMNPNAVIVEEPGYTRADGSSIMPDYRDRLTVRELNDLVAYLKSLD